MTLESERWIDRMQQHLKVCLDWEQELLEGRMLHELPVKETALALSHLYSPKFLNTMGKRRNHKPDLSSTPVGDTSSSIVEGRFVLIALAPDIREELLKRIRGDSQPGVMLDSLEPLFGSGLHPAPGESFEEYFKLSRLARQAYPPDGANAPLLPRLVTGIRDPSLCQQFGGKVPGSLDEVWDIVERTQSSQSHNSPHTHPYPTQSPHTTHNYPRHSSSASPLYPNPSPTPSTPTTFGNPRLPLHPQRPTLVYDPDPSKCGYCRLFGKAAIRCGHNPASELPFPSSSVLFTDSHALAVQGYIESHKSTILIDTGAAVSIVNPKFPAVTNLPCLTPSTPVVLAANNHSGHHWFSYGPGEGRFDQGTTSFSNLPGLSVESYTRV
ncbi:unnamed protein product [Mesocestoides corti]|uniref:Peptidase A2 domain-containing protein n=1 Tax=Mesocestoides corti TaxID=53468 RepID=A0A0R3UAJ1_MESCO|nr:unnamed protein product [Mesocestoides corti]